MVITSFKTYTEAIQFPPSLWPQHFNTTSYVTLLEKMNVIRYMKNTLIVTLSCIAMEMVVLVPAAYAFAKYEFAGKSLMFSLVLVAFMIPTQVTFITVYIMMARARLLKTLLPQIIPFGANAFGIFLLRQAFMQIPEEIVESARLDNASESKIMLQVMLPICKSTIVTIALFSFVSHWNNYFWPLVMTNSEAVQPLTIAMDKLKDVEVGIDWPLIMAGNVVLVAPILIVFIFASRKIISAFAYRGIK
jgi:sn-glycerol 3-phosphate transport system permease protein